MRYLSPAKLNLFFRVLSKRPDGYHSIASLYQAIDLVDDITLTDARSDRLTCTDPRLPCDESNLAWKALQLFRSHYECRSVHIHLDKRIPMQSGLGGGSSNAATVLWALNQRAGGRATIKDLQSLGAQIGSDVAFFLSLGSAYCTGRGEILEPVSPIAIEGYLAKPSYGLSTPLVYRETKIEELESVDLNKVLQGFQTGEPNYFNDLEKAALRIEPRLVLFKEDLLKFGFRHVCMTGSGSAFFCLGDRPEISVVVEPVAKPQFGPKSALASPDSIFRKVPMPPPDMSLCEKYEPALQSSNLGLKASFAIGSVVFGRSLGAVSPFRTFRSIQRSAESWYCARESILVHSDPF